MLLCLLAGGAVATSAHASDPRPYAEYVAEASQRFGIPALWIEAVMRMESAGDPHAVSKAGAIGLMQIMPDTWAELRVRHHLGSDPYDPRNNILAGAAYLSELHIRYGSPGFLAAYNAGPRRYEASLAGRSLPPETRTYVAALAPKIDAAKRGAPSVRSARQPFAWLSAPLFAVPLHLVPVAVSVTATRSPDNTPTIGTPRNMSSIAPRSGDLFVTQAMQGLVQ
jgi:soluble lytic murein transglycosylase-like protein